MVERRDRLPPSLALLGRVRARAGVEQRQTGDALRCLPPQLEGDIAAHRDACDREAGRRARENTRGDRGHRVVEPRLGDHAGRGIRKPLDRPAPHRLVRAKARDEQQRRHAAVASRIAPDSEFGPGAVKETSTSVPMGASVIR